MAKLVNIGDEIKWYLILDTCNANLEEAKLITWFKVGLFHEVVRLSKKHKRLLEHELLILNEPIRRNNEHENIEMLDTFPDTKGIFDSVAAPTNQFVEVESFVFLQETLMLLTLQQKRVIVATILEGRTELETAEKLGISQSAVHQMKERAINRLKRYFNANKLS